MELEYNYNISLDFFVKSALKNRKGLGNTILKLSPRMFDVNYYYYHTLYCVHKIILQNYTV